MRPTGVVAACAFALGIALAVTACSDEKGPATASSASAAANSFAPGASASPSDLAQARALARTLADGLQQSAPTRITPRESDCLVDQVVAHLDVHVLADIASGQPDPRSLPDAVRTAFVDAFDRCLPPDVASALRSRFGR